MSAALQAIVSTSIGMLRRLHLGVGSDNSQRRFPKDDVLGCHGEVIWNWWFLSRYITREICSQNLLQSGLSKTICVTFLYSKNTETLHHAFFIEFWNWPRGGGHFYMQKQCTLRYIYVRKKKHFVWHFYIKNPDTLRYIFIYRKTMHFVLRFYIQTLTYSTDIYKHTYN